MYSTEHLAQDLEDVNISCFITRTCHCNNCHREDVHLQITETRWYFGVREGFSEEVTSKLRPNKMKRTGVERAF